MAFPRIAVGRAKLYGRLPALRAVPDFHHLGPRQDHIGVPAVAEFGDGVGVALVALLCSGDMAQPGFGAFLVFPDLIVGIVDVGRD